MGSYGTLFILMECSEVFVWNAIKLFLHLCHVSCGMGIKARKPPKVASL